ncbi:TetR/AcrR family transcriptional regulator [Herbiconiux sp. CPCC 205763]|uniref:TetR/AcrR family transcriptional regulator n=1 Tax=Herbiconiux aconitum TaxID=2970913 RepID=A0ABT2GM41_9MICO|nr:TetR/AcrR family transcriptional regulator [Herbiconiux aconitum]MCS5717297.1 TetR/AcrR family transcriptional regulator [Herbiconiux aconitum]
MDSPSAPSETVFGLPPSIRPGVSLLGGTPPPERSDAARNRERILAAARVVIARDGIEYLTMDLLATEAGVGKGTIFRRFGSRTGVFRSLLDEAERDFQIRMMAGPPPLGPGADPIERLVAFGRARIEVLTTQGDLLRESEAPPEARYGVPARQVTEVHVMSLLRQAHVDGDLPVLAFNLISMLEAILILPPGAVRGITVPRLADGWEELVRRLVA